jgi:predicted nucleic acid-binding Zn ribbon protein
MSKVLARLKFGFEVCAEIENVNKRKRKNATIERYGLFICIIIQFFDANYYDKENAFL